LESAALARRRRGPGLKRRNPIHKGRDSDRTSTGSHAQAKKSDKNKAAPRHHSPTSSPINKGIISKAYKINVIIEVKIRNKTEEHCEAMQATWRLAT
jgi:hypothetical protein